MALAVFVQALAVLVIALLAAALLLPHAPSWYAEQGGKAAGAFFDGLLDVFGNGKRDSGGDEGRSRAERNGAHAEDAEPVRAENGFARPVPESAPEVRGAPKPRDPLASSSKNEGDVLREGLRG